MLLICDQNNIDDVNNMSRLLRMFGDTNQRLTVKIVNLPEILGVIIYRRVTYFQEDKILRIA